MEEISGDRPLSRRQQIRYIGIFLRRFSGLFARVPYGSFPRIPVAEGSSSLFRKYVDGFLVTSIPKYIPQKNISVFDIGCGGGYIRDILTRGGYTGTYKGLDVVFEERFKNFETTSFTSTFIQSPIESFSIPETFDFVLSNTALEHVKSDKAAVLKAHELCAEKGIEIHIVPSWWSFFIYLWHGYRHYTPGSLKRLFGGTHYTVYKLGGLFSFLTQLILMTLGERYLKIRVRDKHWYSKFAQKSIALDYILPLCPLAYGVIVESQNEN